MYGESKKAINQTQDYDDDGIEQKKSLPLQPILNSKKNVKHCSNSGETQCGKINAF